MYHSAFSGCVNVFLNDKYAFVKAKRKTYRDLDNCTRKLHVKRNNEANFMFIFWRSNGWANIIKWTQIITHLKFKHQHSSQYS